MNTVTVSDLSDVAEYSYATRTEPGDRLVFFAGMCPIDSEGETVAVGDAAEQARACVANLRIALAAAGAQMTDLVQTRLLVATTSHATLVAAWAAYRDAVAPATPPSTLVGVTVLGYEHQLVEVEAVAAIGAARA